MFMLAILVISLAVAVPRVREDIQRDREVETMQRGKQYIRAIKLYYARFHAYPPNIDALVKTNEIRFLRKRYPDPITGKDDWKPIPFGQNKTPIAMGFFGQPLMGGSTLAGTGPGGIAGASPIGTSGGSAFGNGFSNGSSSGSGSSFGSGSSLGGGSSFGSGSSTSSGSSAFGSSDTGSTTGTGTSAGGSSTTGGSSTSSGGDSSGGSGMGTSMSSNQTYGGGGIIGFSPNSPKQSLLFYKTKNHYNEWEFLYSPLTDQMRQGGNAGTIGQPANGLSGGFGATGNGSSTGNGGGFSINPGGSAPTTPSAPTSPQQ
jgi:type II secretory pathway pseudopilin PulG